MYRLLWLGIGVLVLLLSTRRGRPPARYRESRGQYPRGRGELQGSVDAAKGD